MILNRRENVSFSRETVEKVEAAAKELGYQIPRRKMRVERQQADRRLRPTLTNPYYVMLLHGIEEVAKRRITGSCLQYAEGPENRRELSSDDEGVRPRGIIYTCNPSRSCRKKWRSWPRRFRCHHQQPRRTAEIDAVELNKPGRLMARHLLNWDTGMWRLFHLR